MAKYEIIKTTDTDGIWYSLQKDKMHINNSYTRSYEDANEMLHKIVSGEMQGETITESIKTIETNEG